MHKCIGCENLTKTKFCNIACSNKYYNNLRKEKEYVCKKCNKLIKGQDVYWRHLKLHKNEAIKRSEIFKKKCELCSKDFEATRFFYMDGKIKWETRFCNKKCARSFSTHKNREKINKKVSEKLKIVTCKICNKKMSQCKFRRHKSFCIIGEFICHRCGKIFTKRQSCNSHLSHCGKEARSPKKGEMNGWKNKTKEEIKEIKLKANKSLSKSMTGKPGHKHTQETKNLISLKRIEFLENHDNNIHCKWYSINNGLKNINVQGTWEKRFAEYLNKNKIKWDRIRIRFNGHKRYTPDFYLIEEKIYVEIKGWMKQRDIIKMRAVLFEHPDIDLRILEGKKTLKELEENKIKIGDLKKFS